MKSTILFALLIGTCLCAERWDSAASQWTESDARRILVSSPWARRTASGLTLRWESAYPVLMAHYKLGEAPLLEGDRSHFAVAVVGSTADGDVRPQASLKANGRDAIDAVDVVIAKGTVVFLFPRAAEIAEPVVVRLPFAKFGNDVEFRARIGDVQIREKFKLSEMRYLGRQEL